MRPAIGQSKRIATVMALDPIGWAHDVYFGARGALVSLEVRLILVARLVCQT